MRNSALTTIAAVALALSVSCGDSPRTEEPDACVLPPEPAQTNLRFTDIQDMSPDLLASPSRGTPGWGTSDKYAPGIALADLNGDGNLDLIQPRNDCCNNEYGTTRLYQGNGDGTFVDITPEDWDSRKTIVALAFDFDGDDDLDIYLGVDKSPGRLYRNDGDFMFADVTDAAGLAEYEDRVFVASAGDLDADGDIDLYTGAWNASAEMHGLGTAPNRVFLNDGTGIFTEKVGEAQCLGRATLATVLADWDDDGDLDIYVGNDFFDDCLYRNNGDATFVDVAVEAGTDKSSISAMGVATGDIDNDGRLDIFVTDSGKEDESPGNAIFLNRGDMTFENAGVELGLNRVPNDEGRDVMFGWGVGIFDFDADGDNDIHVATHAPMAEVLFQNNNCEFDRVQDMPGVLFGSLPLADARGSAYGDIDNDGDIDIVIARRGDGAWVEGPQAVEILRNDTVTESNTITIEVRPLVRAPSANVYVTVHGRIHVTSLSTGDSYASNRPPVAIVGVGLAETVDRVEVRAVGLDPVVLENVPVGERLVVELE